MYQKPFTGGTVVAFEIGPSIHILRSWFAYFCFTLQSKWSGSCKDGKIKIQNIILRWILRRVNKNLNPHLNIDIHEVALLSPSDKHQWKPWLIITIIIISPSCHNFQKVAVSNKAGTVLYKAGTIHGQKQRYHAIVWTAFLTRCVSGGQVYFMQKTLFQGVSVKMGVYQGPAYMKLKRW